MFLLGELILQKVMFLFVVYSGFSIQKALLFVVLKV